MRLIPIISIVLMLSLSSCDLFKSDGKWVDYGNGLINLSQVARIGYGSQATYDNNAGVEVTNECQSVLGQYEKGKWTRTARIKAGIECDSFVKFDLFKVMLKSVVIIDDSDIENVEKEAEDSLEKLRQFIKGKESYLQL